MKHLFLVCTAITVFASCSKDADPVIIVPPSTGSTIELNGLKGSESGTSAGNSVFVDFSADKQYPVARDSWDLGFYTGADFRIILNSTAVAYAKATTKTDINSVGSTDTAGVKMTFSQTMPLAADFGMMDNISGLISQTLISASATEADNKVYVLNRGTGGGIAARDFMKIRILRNASGYTVQYAPLTATTFNTVQISKSGEAEFIYLSLTNGTSISGFPAKKDWDLQWGYGTYKTGFAGVDVMYPYSDLIVLNVIQNVQAFERVYGSEVLATNAYALFNKDSVSKYQFSADRWVIGGNWRTASQTATGVSKDRFYIIKDASENIYKLKFISFSSQDGGTRGKPQLSYQLIK